MTIDTSTERVRGFARFLRYNRDFSAADLIEALAKERDDFSGQIAAYHAGEAFFTQQAIMERENALVGDCLCQQSFEDAEAFATAVRALKTKETGHE